MCGDFRAPAWRSDFANGLTTFLLFENSGRRVETMNRRKGRSFMSIRRKNTGWFTGAMLAGCISILLLASPATGGVDDRNAELVRAAANGDLSKVNSLLDSGADVNAKDDYSRTALLNAVNGGNREMVKLLLANKADINTIQGPRGNTPLIEAVVSKRVGIALMLLDKGADINAVNKSGSSPLDEAVELGDTNIAKLLLRRGADINSTNDHHTLPLIQAVRKNDTSMMKFLFENGVDVNKKTRTGRTALMSAVFAQLLEPVVMLLDKGAEVNAKTHAGWTALMEASGSFPEPEPKLTWVDRIGITLQYIVRVPGYILGHKPPCFWLPSREDRRDPQIVELLMQKGADVNARDEHGRTALQVARKAGHTGIVNLLKAHGAKE
jgi:ankyrin repeat protein